MNTSAFWIILLVVGFDLLFLPLLLYAMLNGCWSPLVEHHPAAPIADDAVQRNFQSYKIGMMNLGFMVHTAVDEQHLHLQPAWLGRVLRMRAASVPWGAVEPVKRRGKKYAEVKIGTSRVIGPAWALGLAFDDRDAGPAAG
jgi:hypothetical protein